jgi:UDP-perosamine 4-acetyltransferase
MRIAIIGSGGHAKVVADAILALGRDQLVGFFDDDSARWGSRVLGHPVLGAVDRQHDASIDACIVAIGDNDARRQVYTRLKARGATFATVTHPRATLAAGAVLREGTVALAHSFVGVDTCVGANCILNTACMVDHDCVVGAHSHLAPGVTIAGGVSLGEAVFAGTGARIVPGITVGDGAVIGAGAVVICNVERMTTVVGVPARVI